MAEVLSSATTTTDLAAGESRYATKSSRKAAKYVQPTAASGGKNNKRKGVEVVEVEETETETVEEVEETTEVETTEVETTAIELTGTEGSDETKKHLQEAETGNTVRDTNKSPTHLQTVILTHPHP